MDQTSKKTVFGTKEWAEENANVDLGCPNGCWYCYARTNAARFRQLEPSKWTHPIVSDASVERLAKSKTPKRVMFPTQHDITLDNIGRCLDAIKVLLAAGHSLLIVSKPKFGCVAQMCHDLKPFADRIMFRFTIGSCREDDLAKWEPGAPVLAERLESLYIAHGNEFKTSVSCEPLLVDTVGDVNAMVKMFLPRVTDAIWIGKMNFPGERLAINGAPPELVEDARRLERAQSDEFFKRLHAEHGGNPKVKWKESVKKILGIEIPTEPGMDI